MNGIYLKSKSLKAVVLTCLALIATSCGSNNSNPFPGPGGPGGGYGGGACTGPGGVVPPTGLNVGFTAPQVTPPQWISYLYRYSTNWWINFSSQAIGGAIYQTAWAVGHGDYGSRVYLNVTGLPIGGGPITGQVGVNGTIALSTSYVEMAKTVSYYNLQSQGQYGQLAQPFCVTNVQFQGGITPTFSGGSFYSGVFHLQWNYNGYHSSMIVVNGP